MGKGDEAKKPRRPYEEIGAIFNGNEVKIRVPKSTSKPPKLTPSQLKLQQQCTCEDDASVCSETCGLPGERGAGPDNQLHLQIPDDICEALTNRTQLNSELTYSKNEAHEKMCNICNITPDDAPKGVQAQKVLHPDKDVFVLKIGKQTDEPNRTGSIEVDWIWIHREENVTLPEMIVATKRSKRDPTGDDRDHIEKKP
ncbi:unnamed protein product [Diatraea saccharalis]|uniref:Uncharacterized protein n=1 Tax=Diatraea saccharalis TaxID=40085 RepID=A0A9N9MZ51_9NEOP|nr:unnamed protein product [Diatraea saccharalis]